MPNNTTTKPMASEQTAMTPHQTAQQLFDTHTEASKNAIIGTYLALKEVKDKMDSLMEENKLEQIGYWYKVQSLIKTIYNGDN